MQNSLTTVCGTEGFVAPEIIEHSPAYDVQCDMWSLGVVIYIVLGGYRPFRGEGDECMEKIRYGRYMFHDRYWSDVSDEAKILIKRMLTVDPSKRVTAKDALKSFWILSAEPVNYSHKPPTKKNAKSGSKSKTKDKSPKSRTKATKGSGGKET